MIQRIQTVYLLLGVLASAISLCLPIAILTSDGQVVGTVYNLWIQTATGAHDFMPWALFVIQLVAVSTGIISIFLFKNRMLQSRTCMLNILFYIGYYIVYIIFAFVLKTKYQADFSVCIQTALPAVAIIFDYLSRRAVISDEKLVKAADRIR
jgi:hypothetical protein